MIYKNRERTQIVKSGPRSFECRLSDQSPDREGDSIDPAGWRLDNYKRNPIILWAHDHKQLPIARAENIRVEGGALRARAVFPDPGLYPFADQVHDLLKTGFLNSVSVGFRPISKAPNARGGYDFYEQELLEFSIVPIPCHPGAGLERSVREAAANHAAVHKWLREHAPADYSPVYRFQTDDDVIVFQTEDEQPHIDRALLRAVFAQELSSFIQQRAASAASRLTARMR